jgi:hypothetical protein
MENGVGLAAIVTDSHCHQGREEEGRRRHNLEEGALCQGNRLSALAPLSSSSTSEVLSEFIGVEQF